MQTSLLKYFFISTYSLQRTNQSGIDLAHLVGLDVIQCPFREQNVDNIGPDEVSDIKRFLTEKSCMTSKSPESGKIWNKWSSFNASFAPPSSTISQSDRCYIAGAPRWSRCYLVLTLLSTRWFKASFSLFSLANKSQEVLQRYEVLEIGLWQKRIGMNASDRR